MKQYVCLCLTAVHANWIFMSASALQGYILSRSRANNLMNKFEIHTLQHKT